MLYECVVDVLLREGVLAVAPDLLHHSGNDRANPAPPVGASALTGERIVALTFEHCLNLCKAVMLVGDCVAVEGGGVAAASGTMADDAHGTADRLAGFPSASHVSLSFESIVTSLVTDSAHQVPIVRIQGWQVLLLK